MRELNNAKFALKALFASLLLLLGERVCFVSEVVEGDCRL
jgi:hypothetical protein